MRVWAKRLAVLLLASALAAVVSEVAMRVHLRAQGAPYDGYRTLRNLREAANALTQSIPQPGDVEIEGHDMRKKSGKVAHPFLGWDNESLLADLEQHVAAARVKSERDYWVVIVGGSVSSLFAQAVGEDLALALETSPALVGRDVRVLNYGRGSFKQPQQVVMLTWLLGLGIEPDLVLNIDGFNEVALGSANATRGMHAGYPSYNQWLAVIGDMSTDPETLARLVQLHAAGEDARALAKRVADLGLAHSAILGTLAARRQDRLRARAAGAQLEYVGTFADKILAEPRLLGPHFDPETLFPDIVRLWVEGSRSLAALCSARGARYVHVLQPTLQDIGSKPLTDDEQEAGKALRSWVRGVRRGYPLLRKASAELEREGVRFIDASLAFADVTETLYYDPCHFRQAGNERLLAFILDGLQAAVATSD